MAIAVVLLAAGKGRRMKAGRPKVLQEIAGAPLIRHALHAAGSLRPNRVVAVVGPDSSSVHDELARYGPDVEAVVQKRPLGTAHAVRSAKERLDGFDGDVLVLYADTPFVGESSLRAMVEAREAGAAVVVLGFESRSPEEYGRLVRNSSGQLAKIVEARDASSDEKGISLCNSGVVCANRQVLFELVDQVGNANSGGEFYLTDVVGIAHARGLECAVVECLEEEALGINSLQQLARAEAVFQRGMRERAMASGVTLVAPETVHFSFDTLARTGAKIEPYVVFGPGVEIREGALVGSFSHLEGCTIGPGAQVGPFARIRPGSTIGDSARIGNFVEVKASSVGQGTKALHLAYIGDADIGEHSNIGAGTVTCNYDGFSKHRTKIGDRVFIGSNTMLVAPVETGSDSMTAAGSVITRDVPEDALAIARSRQSNKPAFASRLRECLKEKSTGRS